MYTSGGCRCFSGRFAIGARSGGGLAVLAAFWVLSAAAACHGAVKDAPVQDEHAFSDNRQIYSRLVQRLAQLHDEKRTTPGADLMKQFDRKRYPVKLATPGKGRWPLPDLYRKCRESVAIVAGIYKCSKCTKWHAHYGSGYFIKESGVLLTNHHVINHPNNAAFGVMTYDGKVHPVKEVLAADKVNDIVVLQVEGKDFTPLPISSRADIGTTVAVIGHTRMEFYMLTNGIISAYSRIPKTSGPVERMMITADYGVGASGAPVLDERGCVVGMVVETQTVIAGHDTKKSTSVQMVMRRCVPAEVLLRLLK